MFFKMSFVGAKCMSGEISVKFIEETQSLFGLITTFVSCLNVVSCLVFGTDMLVFFIFILPIAAQNPVWWHFRNDVILIRDSKSV